MSGRYTHLDSIKVDGIASTSQQGALIGASKVMPQPSADLDGVTIQYMGLTDSTYTFKCMYTCAMVGSEYKWIDATPVDIVQNSNGVFIGGTEIGVADSTMYGVMSPEQSEKVDTSFEKLETVKEGAEPNKVDIIRVEGTPLQVSGVDKSVNITRNSLGLGDSAQLDVGTLEGQIPVLGANGQLPKSTIPPYATGTYVGSVRTKALLTSLTTAEIGDWAKVTSDDDYNNNGVYILNGTAPEVLTNWVQMVGPANVESVNGKSGRVVLDKEDIGLANVDNISDADKPISTATQTALNAKANNSDLTAHTGNVSNPHKVTKAQVGLGSVDNTSDLDKPISTATQTALDAKIEGATYGGVALSVVDKTIQIPKVDVPSKVSDLDNDKGYVCIRQVTELPSTGDSNVIYSVPDPDGDEDNIRKEYYWTGSRFELFGGSGGALRFTLNVTVTASAGSPDLSGITITATPSSGSAVTGTTDSEGKATIIVKQGQSYTLTYSKTNFSITGDTTYNANDLVGSVSATCYEMPKITVQIKGVDISGRNVYLTSSSGRVGKITDTSGKAVFEGLAIANYTATTDFPEGQGVSPESATISAEAGGDYTIDFTVLAKPVLTVNVTSATGNISGRTVKAVPTSGNTVTASTNSSGVATLTLMGGTTYSVGCDVPSGYIAIPSVEKTVSAGSTDTIGFVLQKKPTVTVTIIDSTGAGLESGRSVQMSNGSDVQTATTNSSGTVTFTANSTGAYHFSVTDLPEGASAGEQTINLEADGSFSVELTISSGWTHSVVFDATVFTTDPTGCLTYADDLSGQTPVSNSSTSLAKATEEGVWAFDLSTGMDCEGCFYATFTDGGVLHQLLNPYNLSEYIAIWNDSSKTWDYSQTGSSAITTENTMFVIPTIYSKGEEGKLSLTSKSSAGTARAHTIGGHTYQYLAIGVYLGYNDNSRLRSVSGKNASGSQTRANFRTFAKANTVQNGVALQLNYHMWRLLTFMCWIRAKSFHMQGRVGQGGLSYSASVTGLCDALGPYAGDVSGTSNASKCLIENFWGSMYQWVDDAYNSGTLMYIGQNENPTDDTENKESIEVFNFTSGFPNAIQQDDLVWGWGTNGSGSSTTGLCDYQNLTSTSNPVPRVGGDSGSVSNGGAGPSCVARLSLANSGSNIGARLAFVFDA